MDITPLIPENKQVIGAYGNHGFTINKVKYEGSVLLFPDVVEPLPDLHHIQELKLTHLHSVLNTYSVDLLLIGCGEMIVPVEASLLQQLRTKNIAYEQMNTGAACRTYNVLLAEGRQVAALLIAV